MTPTTCSRCKNGTFYVLYAAPPIFRCKQCGFDNFDPDIKAITVLTLEEGKKKRPELYKDR